MTSKEQARSLGEQAASAIRSDKPSAFNPEDLQLIERDVLVKLLEVAKAAAGLAMGSDWNNGTHAKHHGYRDKLINALSALRATGKVKL